MSAGADDLAALRAAARRWADQDPDPATRRRLRTAVDEDDLAELRAAMGAPLVFGTAGLRGPVGPGPARMNLATVLRTTHGLAEHVRDTVGTARPVVVGFDARPDSPAFARAAGEVLLAAGLEVLAFAEPVPTPLVAHAARVRAAAAAVVVTASHNPREDNGYKVYDADAIQIVPPDDAAIAAAAAAAPPAAEVPRTPPDAAPDRWTRLGEEDVVAYLADLGAARPESDGPPVRLVYTALHGVGAAVTRRALAEAGHRDVHEVASQVEPDGRFPTTARPNPEEPGTLDAARALAGEVGADLGLAQDPDADRLAVTVPAEDDEDAGVGGVGVGPRRASGGHRPLTGNQLGVLLGDHLLATGAHARPVVASSLVSTPMFAELARRRGARHESTLTGFKWLCRAQTSVAASEGGEPVLAFEEALGYAVGAVVHDKDGIGAAVAAADLARCLAARGATLADRLEELYQELGLWVSRQHGVRLTATPSPGEVDALLDRMAALAATGAGSAPLGGLAVVGVSDQRRAPAIPAWRGPDALVGLDLEEGGRVLLRPSGTEPKVKVYVDLTAPRRGPLAEQEASLGAAADAVAEDLLVRLELA